MAQYDGLSADEVWRKVVYDLLDTPAHTTKSRGGDVVEFLQCTLSIQDPRKRWIISRQPAYNPAYGLVEFIWILNGKDESSILKFWNPGLPQYSGSDYHLHGAYGHRLRANFNVDQIYRAYLALKSNPETRQVVLQIWDPARDLPDELGQPVSPDIPCNIVSLLKLRDNCLYWTQIMRSNDVIRGLPYNIIQFTMLQEMFSSWLKCDVGTYLHLSDSMHMYKSDIDNFHIQENVVPSPEYSISAFDLSYDDTMTLLHEIHDELTSITALNRKSDRGLVKEKLIQTFHPEYEDNKNRPALFSDAMSVIGSDAARRLGDVEISSDLLMHCKNIDLRTAAMNWFTRNTNKRRLV